MTRRRLLLLFGVVAAALLVAVGAANAVYRADATREQKSHRAVATPRSGVGDAGLHVSVLKTERSERLLRPGVAVVGVGLLLFALRGRRAGAAPVRGARFVFASAALGRGPPALRIS